jgi:hypothetical protein
MAFTKLFATLKDTLAKALGRPGQNQKMSPADREFARRLLEGMTAQVAHEQKMVDARGREPVSVRLVPQVPARDRKTPAAWIGGGARLPAGMDWPTIDGSAMQLLAQLDCAKLPPGLWNGLGPRTGWLAIFLDPDSFRAKILHVDRAGPFVASPPVSEGCNMVGYDGRKRAQASDYSWRFSCWPADIVVVTAGGPDPRRDTCSSVRHDRYARRHDIVDDKLWPFDWPTARMMLDTAVAAYETALPPKPAPSPQPDAVARAEAAIVEAQQKGMDADEICGKRVTLEEFRAMAAVREFNARHAAGHLERLRGLKQRLDGMAASQPFTSEAIAPILAEMQAMTRMHKSVPPFYRDGKKLPHAQRLAEGVQTFVVPLTTHDPSAFPPWVYDFESRLLEAAKPVYLRDAAALPAGLVGICEKVWRDDAISEIGGMGHVPWGYIHEFEIGREVTLLELPSSNLIGWIFGDVNNLVITVEKRDLARNDLSRTKVQVTN